MHEKILDNIRYNFTNIIDSSIINIEGLDTNYPAWVVKNDGYYGVAVEYDGAKVSEKFNNVKLWSNSIIVDKECYGYLMLTSNIVSLRNEFALICAEFIYPGEKGAERKKLLEKPSDWWNKWKSLMGNAVINKKVYSIIAEMEIYERLVRAGSNPIWGSFKGATHDIETIGGSYEIKATINRYDTVVNISNQFQLEEISKKLSLVFCRMEESIMGISIEDKVQSLEKLGIDKNMIETTLAKLGVEEGSSIRNNKYKFLDIRVYTVDDNFPKVTLDNLSKDNRESIKKITYSIDLMNLPYTKDL